MTKLCPVVGRCNICGANLMHEKGAAPAPAPEPDVLQPKWGPDADHDPFRKEPPPAPQDVAGLIARALGNGHAERCAARKSPPDPKRCDCGYELRLELAAALDALAQEQVKTERDYNTLRDQFDDVMRERNMFERELTEAREALRELVACKEIHDNLGDDAFRAAHTVDKLAAFEADYQRRKPLAWAAARAAIAAARKGGEG